MAKEGIMQTLLVVAVVLLLLAAIALAFLGVTSYTLSRSMILEYEYSGMGDYGGMLIFEFMLLSVLVIIFGIIDFVLGCFCLIRQGNPVPYWRQLLIAGGFTIVTGYGIGVLVVVAGMLVHQLRV